MLGHTSFALSPEETTGSARRERHGAKRYDQLATKTDVANLGIELRSEMTEMRGDMANMLKTMMITQLATALALAGFVAGLA